MCGTARRIKATQVAYEGATVRMDEGAAPITARAQRWHSFPWWTLWLIWPLISLMKFVGPLIVASIGMISQISVPLVPVVLILVGIWLWRRGT